MLEYRALKYELKYVYFVGGESCCYVIVGMGVGVGVVCNGLLVYGMLYFEVGYMFVKMRVGEMFVGTCSFYGNCVEGMVGSGALVKWWGVLVVEFVLFLDDDDIWEYVVYYFVGMCVNFILIFVFECIVFGGGVM